MPSKGCYKIYIAVLHPEVFGLYCQMYIDVTKFINSSKFDVKDFVILGLYIYIFFIIY